MVNSFRLIGGVCALGVVCGMLIPLALGQPLPAPKVGKEDSTGPRQPTGIFGELGEYQTIAGVRSEANFAGKSTLLVDTVGVKKLDKPVTIWVENLELPVKKRCVIKGYEMGRMIGTPPAVHAAAKELGKEITFQRAAWQWQPYFVALVVVEPTGLEILKGKD